MDDSLCIVHHPEPVGHDTAPLFPEQPPHPTEHAILLRIVRVVFAWNLKDGRKRLGEAIDAVADPFRDLVIP
jgi:hypothetical protein